MKGHFYLNEIEFNNGTQISVKPDDILIFVGSNNVGKSTAINNITGRGGQNHKVVTRASYKGDGEFKDWLSRLMGKNQVLPFPYTYLSNTHFRSQNELEQFWKTPNVFPLKPGDINYLSTVNRLTFSNPQEARIGGSNNTHPLFLLKNDWKLENKVNEIFKQAFNTNLMVDRQNIGLISLHVGKIPDINIVSDPRYIDFYQNIRNLPQISNQGDGMRSFASMLLALYTSNVTQIVIDEPESFLHPGQTKILGKLIAKHFDEKQVFISTHSSDFIKGILDANSNRVKIIRIIREGEYNTPCVLNETDIKQTWNDPKIKHSSIIDGVFHESVIVCESDGDCRLFTAILNSQYEEDYRFHRIADTLFVPAHGKGKVPSIVTSLRKLSVPTYSILDFDVLNDPELLKRMLSSHGGDWNAIKTDWTLINTKLGNKEYYISKEDILKTIEEELSQIASDIISEKRLKSLKDSLGSKTAWANVKRLGLNGLEQGEIRNAGKSILNYLRSIGIFVIPSGELESLDTSISNSSKTEWLDEVLSKDLTNPTTLKEGKEFLEGIIDQLFPVI